MKIKKIINGSCLLLCIMISNLSCSKYDKDLKSALNLAGRNGVELEKVLVHYGAEEDTLKYKAACYLIKNMPYYFYQDGDGLQEILSAKDSLKLEFDKIPVFKENKITGMIKTEKFNNFLIKLKNDLPNSDLAFDLRRYSDIENISAEFLIENIDYAFKAWNLPWAKHLTFEQFCEYVLPYRSGRQKPNAWRKYYFDKYKDVIDSLKMETDPVKVAAIFNKKFLPLYKPFRGSFNTKMTPFTYLVPGKFMTELGIDGNCVMTTITTVEVMRALGIPIARIFTDKDGFSAGNHILVAVLDKNGEWKGFHCGGQNPGDFEPESQITKIYRETSIPRNNNSVFKSTVNAKLNHFEWEDVTKEFMDVHDISIEVPEKYINKKIAYLCIFNRNSQTTWVPIDGGELDGNKIIFKSIGGDGVVYLPMVEDDYGNLNMPISQPFFLDEEGKKHFFKPNGEYMSFEFIRKFPFNKWFEDIAKPLVGGRFEGSKDKNFKNPIELARIQDNPIDDENIIDIGNFEFRYVRFVYPNNTVESKYGLSSISFYNSNDNRSNLKLLKGDYIFSEGVTKDNMDILFDNDLLSYVDVYQYEEGIDTPVSKAIFSRTNSGETWVGLDLKETQKITHVGFAPRNPKNNIYVGMEYELFYWDEMWKSLGVQRATKKSIEFTDIPKGALLWLRNHSEGQEERIFYFDGDEIIWK